MLWVNKVLSCTPLLLAGCLHPPCGNSAGAVASARGGSAGCRFARSGSWPSLSHSHPSVWPSRGKWYFATVLACFVIVCLFFFPFLQHPRLRLAAMQLLPSFTKFHEVLSEGISVNTLLLGGIVPSCVIHPLSSTHSAVSWIHPWPNSYHQSRWKWSVERPFPSFSNSEPGDQFSCSRNCTWSLQVPDLAHPEVDSKIPPDLSAAGATSGLQSWIWLYRTAQAQVSCLLGVKHTNMCFK